MQGSSSITNAFFQTHGRRLGLNVAVNGRTLRTIRRPRTPLFTPYDLGRGDLGIESYIQLDGIRETYLTHVSA